MCACGCILGDLEESWYLSPFCCEVFVVVALLELVRGGIGIAPGRASRAMMTFKACVCVRIGVSKEKERDVRERAVVRGHAYEYINDQAAAGQSSIHESIVIIETLWSFVPAVARGTRAYPSAPGPAEHVKARCPPSPMRQAQSFG